MQSVSNCLILFESMCVDYILLGPALRIDIIVFPNSFLSKMRIMKNGGMPNLGVFYGIVVPCLLA